MPQGALCIVDINISLLICLLTIYLHIVRIAYMMALRREEQKPHIDSQRQDKSIKNGFSTSTVSRGQSGRWESLACLRAWQQTETAGPEREVMTAEQRTRYLINPMQRQLLNIWWRFSSMITFPLRYLVTGWSESFWLSLFGLSAGLVSSRAGRYCQAVNWLLSC